MPTALVTGATAGIGAAFAAHLAARGDDLVLVARDAERLRRTAAELAARHGVTVEVLSADLGVAEQVERVATRLTVDSAAAWSAEPVKGADDVFAGPVDLLVNNAGFGIHTRLLAEDAMDHIDPAIDVMIRAVVRLSNAAGRAMRHRGHGAIVNVSSTAGFVTMGAYSAVKTFVTSYTESLAAELRGSGVSVTVLCPGYVRTEFHQRAGIRTEKLPSIAWVDPDLLIRECLADVAKGKVVSIPTLKYKVAIAFARLAPRAVVRTFSAKLSSTR